MFRASIVLLFLGLAGCESSSLRDHGIDVHEETDFHHQLFHGREKLLEGYYLGSVSSNDEAYAFALKGSAFNCGEGNKFVLDREVSVFVIHYGKLNQVATSGKILMGDAKQKYRAAVTKKLRLEKRLPMLFSSDGCIRDLGEKGVRDNSK